MSILRTKLKDSIRRLAEAGIPDPESDAFLLASHITGMDRMSLHLNGNMTLTDRQEQQWDVLLLSRCGRTPLQYLTGEQYFYGYRFQVDPRVLIPRPETELLCEAGLKFLHGRHKPKVLDLCTGSGAIACTIALECPEAEVTASDLSPEALSAAAANAKALEADISFVRSDLLANLEGTYDLIISNPPYIPAKDCDVLQAEVRFEPRMALDGGADGLDFYRRIAEEAPSRLTPGGMIALECGEGQCGSVAAFLSEAGLIPGSVIIDLNGIERDVTATKPI